MIFTCNAVLPIILTIATGYFLKKIRLLPKDFFPLLNKLCFRCCLPCLLCYNVYNLREIKEIAAALPVVIFAVASILCFFFIGLLISIFSTKDNSQRGVMLQAAFRSNYAIIGLSLSLSISSEPKASAIASVLSSVSIPLFNILATIALSVFCSKNEKKGRISNMLKKIATNPLILGCATGFVFLLIRAALPKNDSGEAIFLLSRDVPFAFKTLQNLALAASTIALIALGGNFELSAVSRLKKLIAIGTFSRVILCPLVCLFFAYAVGFRATEFPALIALYGTPIAVSSVPMAAEMDGDAELAGQLVVWTSLCSAFTLFLTIFFCAKIGIFEP